VRLARLQSIRLVAWFETAARSATDAVVFRAGAKREPRL